MALVGYGSVSVVSLITSASRVDWSLSYFWWCSKGSLASSPVVLGLVSVGNPAGEGERTGGAMATVFYTASPSGQLWHQVLWRSGDQAPGCAVPDPTWVGVWGPRLPWQMRLETQLPLHAGNPGRYRPPPNSGNRDTELRKRAVWEWPVFLSTPATYQALGLPSPELPQPPSHRPGCMAAALLSTCHSSTKSHQPALSAGSTGNQSHRLSQAAARCPARCRTTVLVPAHAAPGLQGSPELQLATLTRRTLCILCKTKGKEKTCEVPHGSAQRYSIWR